MKINYQLVCDEKIKELTENGNIPMQICAGGKYSSSFLLSCSV